MVNVRRTHQERSSSTTPRLRIHSGARRAAAVAGLLALSLSTSACGLRRSHADALAALNAGTTPQQMTGQVPGASQPTGPGTRAVLPNGSASLAPSTQGPHAPGPVSTGVPTGTGPADASPTKPVGQASGATCTGTGSTVTIGTVGEQSGIFAPFLQPVVQAVQAWVAATNAAGGINCHPLRYIVKDDGGDPSTHQSQVQELVEQDHVIAMVGMDSPIAGNASVDYLTQHGIPVIGSEGGSDWFYSSPVYRPQITTGATALGAIVRAVAQIGKPQGKHTLALVSCLEASLCSSLYSKVPQLAKDNGLTLGYRTQASLTQPDFTSVCQSAQNAKADLFIAGMDTNSIQRLLKNCGSIGYHPIYITGGPLVSPPLVADPRAEGFYMTSYSDLYSDTANPQIKAMRDTLARYAPNVPPSISATAGWTAAQLFQLAMQKATAPTPKALLAALNTIKGNDLGGLTSPLTFSPGANAPRKVCFWVGQVHNQAVRAAPGLPTGRSCA